MSCLDVADSRLCNGGAAQADEVLNLLQAAIVHLEQALEPSPGELRTRRGAE